MLYLLPEFEDEEDVPPRAASTAVSMRLVAGSAPSITAPSANSENGPCLFSDMFLCSLEGPGFFRAMAWCGGPGAFFPNGTVKETQTLPPFQVPGPRIPFDEPGKMLEVLGL